MQALTGFAWLLFFQLAAEVIARVLGLPFPGPVLGLLLLLPALAWPRLRAPVSAAAGLLLSHLSLFFVPAGVGVLAHLTLLRDYGGRIALVLVVSTWVGMVATVLALRVAREPSDG